MTSAHNVFSRDASINSSLGAANFTEALNLKNNLSEFALPELTIHKS
jgi:hypothetical protein